MESQDIASDIAVIKNQMLTMAQTQIRLEKKIDKVDSAVEKLSDKSAETDKEITELKTTQKNICAVIDKSSETQKSITELETTVKNFKWITALAMTALATLIAVFQFFRGGGS